MEKKLLHEIENNFSSAFVYKFFDNIVIFTFGVTLLDFMVFKRKFMTHLHTVEAKIHYCTFAGIPETRRSYFIS